MAMAKTPKVLRIAIGASACLKTAHRSHDDDRGKEALHAFMKHRGYRPSDPVRFDVIAAKNNVVKQRESAEADRLASMQSDAPEEEDVLDWDPLNDDVVHVSSEVDVEEDEENEEEEEKEVVFIGTGCRLFAP